jgi:hypothetical protein
MIVLAVLSSWAPPLSVPTPSFLFCFQPIARRGEKAAMEPGCSAWSSYVSRSPPLAKIGSNPFPLFFSPHVFPLCFRWTATKSSTIGQRGIDWPVVRQFFLLFVLNPAPNHSNRLRFWRILLLRVCCPLYNVYSSRSGAVLGDLGT